MEGIIIFYCVIIFVSSSLRNKIAKCESEIGSRQHSLGKGKRN